MSDALAGLGAWSAAGSLVGVVLISPALSIFVLEVGCWEV